MNNRLLCFLCLLVFMACAGPKKQVAYFPVFPDDWLGEWQGKLEIYGPTGKTMEVPMQCVHRKRKDGQYDWYLIYASGDQKEERKYRLTPVSAKAGHYVVDEGNGILLDGFVFHDRFISTFEVMGNVLQTQYIKHKEGMDFQVTMHALQSFHSSGDTIIANDTIPPVNSYKTAVFQQARLKRKDRDN